MELEKLIEDTSSRGGFVKIETAIGKYIYWWRLVKEM